MEMVRIKIQMKKQKVEKQAKKLEKLRGTPIKTIEKRMKLEQNKIAEMEKIFLVKKCLNLGKGKDGEV